MLANIIRLRSRNANLLRRGLSSLPHEAQVVVIGGGVIGNSIAYHLGRNISCYHLPSIRSQNFYRIFRKAWYERCCFVRTKQVDLWHHMVCVSVVLPSLKFDVKSIFIL
jgi:hypothetical protein